MAWWMAIPAVLQGISAISGSAQQKKGAETQAIWGQYNASMSYNTAQANIAAQSAIAAANANAIRTASSIDEKLLYDTTALNVAILGATSNYNDLLLEKELSLMWEGAELDEQLLARQRAKERGSIEAQQAASGTLMGQDSAGAVVVDQQTQEALDAFVIRHNADIAAGKIQDARAQNAWQGQMEIQKTLWDGQLTSIKAQVNSELQANTILTQAAISAGAGYKSARNKFMSDSAGVQMGQIAGNQAASNTLTSGLFGAASTGISAYYQNKQSTINNPGTSLAT
jgi:hypothetical protein